MSFLKFFQLNIEGDNHYHRILPFLEAAQPEVLCFQEFFEVDIPVFQKQYPHVLFAPLAIINERTRERLEGKGKLGVVIFSKLPFLSTQKNYYVGSEEKLNIYVSGNPNLFNRAIISVEILKENKLFQVATTHFTWTPEGSVTDEQRQHLKELLKIIDEIKPLILCGDFNAPRGKEIFDTLATHLKDNVPPELKTSIDQNLHRIQGIQLMVDGFFTSPEFKVSRIRMVDGVSDHQGLLAEVESSVETQ